MPEERNRLAPPTRLPGGWLGCLGLDTHFQRLFSSSRTHQPPSLPRVTVDSYLIVPILPWSFTAALAHEFYFSRRTTRSMENGTRSRARSLRGFDVIYMPADNWQSRIHDFTKHFDSREKRIDDSMMITTRWKVNKMPSSYSFWE